MSERPLNVETEVVPEPTEAVFYAWAVEWKGGGHWLTGSHDSAENARAYDPRKTNENARAALVKVVVPLSELRRLR